MVKVQRPFWLLAEIDYWYPDLHDERRAPFFDLLDLHRKVTEHPDVRAILYDRTKEEVIGRDGLR